MVRAYIVIEIFFIIKEISCLTYEVFFIVEIKLSSHTASFESETEIIVLIVSSFSSYLVFWNSIRQASEFSDDFVDFLQC